MFAIDESTVTAVRRAFAEQGELAAVIELQRHFPGISDRTQARQTVRLITGWQPPAGDPSVTSA